MRVVGSRQFAMLTLGMSLPLLFSFQLQAPPTFLQGVLYILIWTWAVVSVITVPVLIGLEIIACVFHVRRQNLGQARRTLLLFHATVSFLRWLPKSCSCQQEDTQLDAESCRNDVRSGKTSPFTNRSREQRQQLPPPPTTLSKDGFGLLRIRAVFPAGAASFQPFGRPRASAHAAMKLAAAILHGRRPTRGLPPILRSALGRLREIPVRIPVLQPAAPNGRLLKSARLAWGFAFHGIQRDFFRIGPRRTRAPTLPATTARPPSLTFTCWYCTTTRCVPLVSSFCKTRQAFWYTSIIRAAALVKRAASPGCSLSPALFSSPAVAVSGSPSSARDSSCETCRPREGCCAGSNYRHGSDGK